MSEQDSDSSQYEEENYFVSLGDLMTGVVFIFVILLVGFALEYRSAQSRLETQRATASAALAAAQAARTDAATRESQLNDALVRIQGFTAQVDALAQVLREREQYRRQMLEELVRRLTDRGVRVELDEDSGIIRLPEAMLFLSGQASLRPEGQGALEIVAEELLVTLRDWCSPKGRYRLEALFVEGHTDDRPIHGGRFRDNWELSTARAVTTSRALLAAAAELDSFRSRRQQPIIGVSGYGETRPVAANGDETGRQRNRRIDLRFLVDYPEEDLEKVRLLLNQAQPAAKPR